MYRPGSRRPRSAALALLAAVVLAAAFVVHLIGRPAGARVTSVCTVPAVGGGGIYSLSPEQTLNASIIAGVAARMALPDHAVSVALATSLQEAGLRNLRYGDRDSVGLFQQRPSQGWGTPAQILDPVYAATAFFGHLEQVPGWQSMAVTAAAQAVQRSAAPDAYSQWESEARSLAVALTGEAPAALGCLLSPPPSGAPAMAALGAAARAELGRSLSGSFAGKAGWQVAEWLVGHASAYNLRTVSFGTATWSAATGKWAGPSVSAERGAALAGSISAG